MQNQHPVIAIVGGGFSGTMVAVHLLRRAVQPLTIKLIEPRPALGRGVAYSTSFDNHVLNVPAAKMSAFTDEPLHFWQWLQNRIPAVSPNDFVPRQHYGDYVQTILAKAIAKAPSHVQLEHFQDEAIAIKLDDLRAVIELRSGEQITADRVVLALGNFPPGNPPIADPSFYQSKRYFPWAWSGQDLSQIAIEDPVMLIGSGLTAIDMVMLLHQRGHQGAIHLVSRRGLLPQSHRSVQPLPHPLHFNRLPTTVRALLHDVRQEIKAVSARGSDWRAVIDALRPHTQQLWQQLPDIEQRRFLRHLRAYWDVHRHRLAPTIAETLHQTLASGQVQFHSGRIEAYQEDDRGVNVVVRSRGNPARQTLRAAFVLNCTGSECDYRKFTHPLVQHLLAIGLIRADALALGLEVDATGALIGADGVASPILYTLGPPQKGRLWETTAVPEIRGQAEQLAQILLQSGSRKQ